MLGFLESPKNKKQSFIEYSIITDNDELHTENLSEAQDYFDSLSKNEKKSCQYFSKRYIRIDGEWLEDEVIILK
jgi:hypothetical protein